MDRHARGNEENVLAAKGGERAAESVIGGRGGGRWWEGELDYGD